MDMEDACITKEEQKDLERQTMHWIWMALGGIVSFAVILTLVYFLYSPVTFGILLKAALSRIPAFIVAIFSLLASVLAFEKVAPHDFLKTISTQPWPAAFLLGMYVMGVALIIAYVY